MPIAGCADEDGTERTATRRNTLVAFEERPGSEKKDTGSGSVSGTAAGDKKTRN
jgi:hypothetical protein